MQLIHALAAGIPSAANGLVRIYRRGTATRATWYASFEADSANSSAADIPLDSTGSAIVYVNEVVQVVVVDSGSQQLRDFVSGEQAYAVEVRSQSFTGTNYDSGAQAAGSPTTDGAVLDRWKDSAGAIDWFVLYSGAAASLQNAIGAIYGLFFNVKSPEFGALGNGADNDAAAIQAAFDAAAVRGGVVVFPPGTYDHAAEITWQTGVSVIAVPGTVTLRQTTAGQSNLRLTSALASGPDTPTICSGIKFDSTVTNSATQMQIGHGSGDEVHIIDCKFNGSSFATGTAISFGGTLNWRTLIRNCTFQSYSETPAIIDTASAGTGRIDVEGGSFATVAGAFDESLVVATHNPMSVRGATFTFQATSGTSIGIEQAGVEAVLQVSGCSFITTSAGPASYVAHLFDGSAAYFADDNRFVGDEDDLLLYQMTPGEHLAVGGSYLTMRPFQHMESTDTTDTMDAGYKAYNIRSTNDGTVDTPSFEAPYLYYAGQTFEVIINNASGTNWTGVVQITYDTGHILHTRSTTPWPAINTSARISLRFLATNLSSSWDWIQIGDTQAAEF